jgi:hypothetical protein
MNDLSAKCGSGRLGTSCHSFASLHEDCNTVTWELGGKSGNYSLSPRVASAG